MFDPCSDLAAAKWIAASDEHWGKLVTLGPPGFPAYARLRFIPDPVHEGQSENDAVRQADAPSDNDQLRIAVGTLLRHTDAPDEGYLLMWDGWGRDSFPEPVLRTPRLTVPNREYYLCRVSLPDFVSGAIEDSWQAETNRLCRTPRSFGPRTGSGASPQTPIPIGLASGPSSR